MCVRERKREDPDNEGCMYVCVCMCVCIKERSLSLSLFVSIRFYRVVPGNRNWQIETADWIWPVFYYVL